MKSPITSLLTAGLLGALIPLTACTVPAQHGSDDYHGLFHHLEQAIGALQKLGRKEQAQKLTGWAKELRAGLDRRGRREEDQPRRRRTERQVAMEQVELMMHSAKTLAKAKRHDAADSLERAAKAIHMRVQGRRDEEAQQFYKSAPSRRATGIHLAMAAEHLQDQGDEKHAEMVGKLSRQFLGKRESERERERDDDDDRDRRRERRDDDENEDRKRKGRRERDEEEEEEEEKEEHENKKRSGDRERAHQEQMHKLMQHLERMHKELEKLRRDVDRLQRRRRR